MLFRGVFFFGSGVVFFGCGVILFSGVCVFFRECFFRSGGFFVFSLGRERREWFFLKGGGGWISSFSGCGFLLR